MASEIVKRCTKCGEHKPIELFPLCRGKPRARCKPCHTGDARAWAVANPERARERGRDWHYANNPPAFCGPPLPPHIEQERRRQSRKRWADANPEADLAAKKKWAEANPHIAREVVRRRQASKLRATPAWADRKAMQAVYLQARMLSQTGQPHDVDHIVPLQSPLVCGLHCPANLRVIPRRQNRQKHNRHWPDMPDSA